MPFRGLSREHQGPVSSNSAKPPQVQGAKRCSHLLDRLAAHRETEQAHIDQQQRSHEEREANQVNAFDNREIAPASFAVIRRPDCARSIRRPGRTENRR